MVVSFLTTVNISSLSQHLVSVLRDVFFGFDLSYACCVLCTVAYGVERINREVSTWMRNPTNYEDSPQMPFIATRGYDSVVWSRLYSRETSELEDYQIEQASLIEIPKILKTFNADIIISLD